MVMNELRGEKIDIVPWSDDVQGFVGNALSPAKVKEVRLQDDGQTALVIVPDYQLSLAIGKEGQNARLAARLTGLRVDIKSESQLKTAAAPEPEVEPAVPEVPEPVTPETAPPATEDGPVDAQPTAAVSATTEGSSGEEG
jgi:N utilization substance protein A